MIIPTLRKVLHNHKVIGEAFDTTLESEITPHLKDIQKHPELNHQDAKKMSFKQAMIITNVDCGKQDKIDYNQLSYTVEGAEQYLINDVVGLQHLNQVLETNNCDHNKRTMDQVTINQITYPYHPEERSETVIKYAKSQCNNAGTG
jgi:hypothetical protein